MFNGLSGQFNTLYNVVKWSLILSIPLALWKLFDIAVWIFTHVSVTVK